jgi:hypothetical protein
MYALAARICQRILQDAVESSESVSSSVSTSEGDLRPARKEAVLCLSSDRVGSGISLCK